MTPNTNRLDMMEAIAVAPLVLVSVEDGFAVPVVASVVSAATPVGVTVASVALVEVELEVVEVEVEVEVTAVNVTAPVAVARADWTAGSLLLLLFE